jgi:hypothetical protein
MLSGSRPSVVGQWHRKYPSSVILLQMAKKLEVLLLEVLLLVILPTLLAADG